MVGHSQNAKTIFGGHDMLDIHYDIHELDILPEHADDRSPQCPYTLDSDGWTPDAMYQGELTGYRQKGRGQDHASRNRSYLFVSKMEKPLQVSQEHLEKHGAVQPCIFDSVDDVGRSRRQ